MDPFMIVSSLALLAVFVWGGLKIAERNEEERKRTFAGEVVDRRHERVALTSGERNDYWLLVRTDSGEMVTCMVKGTAFGRFAVGDRVVKRAGERWPELET